MHAPMWTLKCRKTFWSCDAKAHNSFFYFSQPSVSKICSFINLWIHPNLFWVFEKLSQHFYPLGVHIFFQKLVMISEFFQRKVGNYLFSQACCFQLDNFLFLLFYFFSFLPSFLFLLALFSLSSFSFSKLFIICSFPLSSFFFSLFLSEKVVRTRAHTTYLRLTTR